MVGCSKETNKSTKLIHQFKILQIDSCEYLRVSEYYGFTHKGNCRFCAERRKKELEELVIRCKTPLKVTYKDDVATDTIVIFKDKKK